jgi:hypothetical protein
VKKNARSTPTLNPTLEPDAVVVRAAPNVASSYGYDSVTEKPVTSPCRT